jgi:hypothetical protein
VPRRLVDNLPQSGAAGLSQGFRLHGGADCMASLEGAQCKGIPQRSPERVHPGSSDKDGGAGLGRSWLYSLGRFSSVM